MTTINHLKLVLKGGIWAAVILLSACTQQYGDGEQRTSGDHDVGRELYSAECASCHGPSGEGGSGGALIACATCGTQDSLLGKIERDMPSAADPMTGEDAENVAAFILAEFNGDHSGAVARAMPGVSTMTPNEAVYKLAFELAGRLPTSDEVETFSSSLTGEREVVYGFMNTDYFYERLKDIFNDSLLTDARRDENNPRRAGMRDIDDLYRNTFTQESDGQNYSIVPDLNWEADYLAENSMMLSTGYLRHFSREAIARKPLLLVEYLARNDRDFREFVSAKYTVANRFSFEAFNNGPGRPNMKVVDPDQSDSNGALPFATDVTWKEWGSQRDMLDYLEVVRLYNYPASNDDINQNYILDEFPYDPRDIKPVQLYYNGPDGLALNTGVPHSGILSDELFLNKYTATETNMHRNRARMAYWFFAGKDLLAIEGNRDVADLEFEDFGNVVGVDDPTATNPDCLVCHEVMDPVAKAFENYDLEGVYDTTNPDAVDSHDGIVGWGLSKHEMPSSGAGGYNNRELQWLGEQIAADASYPMGIAQIVIKGLTGQDVLGQPGADSPEGYIRAYEAQALLIKTASSEFAGNGFNIKDLIYAITKSAYYRSTGLYFPNLAEEYKQVGSVRYLPPQLLNQKLRALNSGGWGRSLNLYSLDDRMFLGGKNSTDVLKDADSVSGIISAVTERMAVEEACDIVRNEFRESTEDRLLFSLVEDTTNMQTPTAAARLSQARTIRKQIVRLYLAALHQEVRVDSEQVDIAFDLFMDVLADDVDTSCDTGSSGNRRAVREAWYAVMVYILTDYRFIYS